MRLPSQGGFTGHNDNLIVFAILAILVMIALPSLMKAQRSPALLTRANLAAVQQGVERYAQDNGARYPAGLHDPGFDWARYLPPSPQPLANPFAPAQTGPAAVAPDVALQAGLFPYPVARDDKRPGEPGQARYYVSKDRRHYALLAFDQAGPVRATTLLSSFGLETPPLLVYHNAQVGKPASGPPTWWTMLLRGAALIGILLALAALALTLIALLLNAGFWLYDHLRRSPPAG